MLSRCCFFKMVASMFDKCRPSVLPGIILSLANQTFILTSSLLRLVEQVTTIILALQPNWCDLVPIHDTRSHEYNMLYQKTKLTLQVVSQCAMMFGIIHTRINYLQIKVECKRGRCQVTHWRIWSAFNISWISHQRTED